MEKNNVTLSSFSHLYLTQTGRHSTSPVTAPATLLSPATTCHPDVEQPHMSRPGHRLPGCSSHHSLATPAPLQCCRSCLSPMTRWPCCFHISVSPFFVTFLRLLCLLLQLLLIPHHRCFFLYNCVSSAQGCCWPLLVCLEVLRWLESIAGASLPVLELRCWRRTVSP